MHGPDEQRFYNTVCFFYGASPENRSELAVELGLPEERMEYCPDEYLQAADAWDEVLDSIWHRHDGEKIEMVPNASVEDTLTFLLISEEVALLRDDCSGAVVNSAHLDMDAKIIGVGANGMKRIYQSVMGHDPGAASGEFNGRAFIHMDVPARAPQRSSSEEAAD